MATLTIPAAKVSPIVVYKQITAPLAEAVTAGQYVRFAPSTGRLELGNATTTAEVGEGFIALSGGGIGQTITAMKEGLLNVSDGLGSMNYGAAVYLSDTDGVLADTAGTVSTIVGRVYPAWSDGATAKRILWVKIS